MAILISRDGTELKGAGNVSELSAESKKIVNLAAPTEANDAATKDYVDNASGSAANALDGTFTIDNTADNTKKIDFDASGITTGNARTIIMPDADVDLGLVSSAIQGSQKGAANGVVPLNALSKIEATYLPSYVDDVEEYANLASLPGTGEQGKIYVTLDTNKTFRWSGSAYIEISPSEVNSVNGETGVVVLDSDDIGEGSSNLYFTDARAKLAAVADSISDGVTDVAPSQNAVFDALALKAESSALPADSDDVSEGSVNLYFTDARAKSAAVADSIADSITDVAPSQNAVFDALALKADQSDLGAAEGEIDDLQADSGKVFDAGLAGEGFGANEIWLVRRAKSGETAGRYYKAQANSFANSRVVGFVIVGASAVTAADPIRVYKFGEGALGSADAGLGAGNINAPVYLHQSSAGKFTLSPTTTSGSIIKPVGFVGNDLVLEFQPDLAIQA